MSLILDALRKIELERKVKRQGGIDLRPEVLSYRGTPQKPANTRWIFIVAGAILVIMSVAAITFLRGEKAVSLTGTEPVAKAAPVTRAASPEPLKAAAPELLPVSPAQPRPVKARAEIGRREVAPRPGLNEGTTTTTTGGGGADNITVSGIAWQDERRMRRAVVNGALLAEGAEVQGARIVEIKENRVKFSRSGQLFEVLYPSATSR